MWVFTRYGFYSAVAARRGKNGTGSPDPKRVQVRARNRDHLVALKARFPDRLGKARMIATPQADYQYRIVVAAEVWRAVAEELAGEAAGYANFKAECDRFAAGSDDGYVEALHRVWATMARYQIRAASVSRRGHT